MVGNKRNRRGGIIITRESRDETCGKKGEGQDMEGELWKKRTIFIRTIYEKTNGK